MGDAEQVCNIDRKGIASRKAIARTVKLGLGLLTLLSAAHARYDLEIMRVWWRTVLLWFSIDALSITLFVNQVGTFSSHVTHALCV